eukprot:gnl/MRDRNA2_/MRDRNA2_101613_c0_seq1.p1 gnl/MRDRNA2_/MRDRNA2_101613_c0~~gnl/MRDRNA2_/MRDRNA2_101613_c0_seq1.p1  ORF type:complete len:1006 (+),score=221.40 gnl/MRDRNA2_/MRDRNA2_101613_c0_seq1:60-3077(+)
MTGAGGGPAEVVPQVQFARQNALLATLAELTNCVVQELGVPETYRDKLKNIAEQVRQIGTSGGITVTPSNYVSARTSLVGSPRGAHTETEPSRTVQPHCFRVEDFRHDLSELLKWQTQARAEFDHLNTALRDRTKVADDAQKEIQRIRVDLKDAQEALITHEGEIKDASLLRQRSDEHFSKKIGLVEEEGKGLRLDHLRETQETRELLMTSRAEIQAQQKHAQRQLEEATKMLEARMTSFRDDLCSSINAAELRAKQGLVAEEHARKTWEQGSESKAQDLAMQNKKDAEGLAECTRRAHAELEDMRSQLQAEIHSHQRQVEEQRASLLNMISEQTRGLESRGRTTADELAQTRSSLEGLATEFRTARREAEDDRHKLMLRLDDDNRKRDDAMEKAANVAQHQASDAKTEAISAARKQMEDASAVLRMLVENTMGENRQLFQRDHSQLSARLDAAADSIARRLDAVTALVEAKGARTEEIRIELQAGVQGEQRRTEELGAQMLQKQEEILKFVNQELLVNAGQWEDKHLDVKRALDHTKQALELRVETVQTATNNLRTELQEDVHCIQKEATATKQALQTHTGQLQNDVATLRDQLNGEVKETAKRILQEAERADAQVQRTADELQSAIRFHHEDSRADCGRIRAELQESMARADQQLQRAYDTTTARLEQLNCHLVKVQGDASAQHDQSKEALSAMSHLVDRAQDQASEAKRRAAAAELATREAIAGLQEGEIRCLTEGLSKVRCAAGSLTSGVIKIAQCIGLLPAHDGQNEAIGDAGTPLGPRWDKVDLQDLLQWEKVGNPLAERIGKAWHPMISANSTTLVDMVQRKAESATMKLLQMAIRDLDVRVSGVLGERDAWRELHSNFTGVKTPAASSAGRAIAAAQSFNSNFGPASRIAFGLDENGPSARHNGAGFGLPETPTGVPSMMSPLSSAVPSSAIPTPSHQGCVAPRGDPLVMARIAAYGDGMSGRAFRSQLDSDYEDKVLEPLGSKPEGDPRRHRSIEA